MQKTRNFLLKGLCLGIALSVCNTRIPVKQDANFLPDTGTSSSLSLDELRDFAEIFQVIKQAYVEPITDKKLFEEATRGMLSNLDPHSAYMASEEYQEFEEAASGEFVGLGIEVIIANGFVKLISPIDDTPAQKAGLQAGDLIVQFDDKPVKHMTPEDITKLIRGEIGSEIVLTVVREGINTPLKFSITRDVIKSKSVKQQLLEKNLGYLRITSFQPDTGKMLLAAIDSLKQENAQPLSGLVLDLRDNPGGLLREAIAVCDAFLDTGLIVSTQGRIDNSEMQFKATSEDVLQGAPIIVLINGGSASASEIVAGALQDNRRALIMGEKSFGKGSVQTVMPTATGAAIKLTVARYFTPSGRSIQAEGIVPDVQLARMKLKALETAPVNALNQTDETAKPLHDYALSEAVNVLKGMRVLAQRP